MKLHFLLLALLAVQPFIADTNTFFPKNLYKSPPRRLETTASSSNSTNSTNSTSSTNSTNSTNPTQPVILPNGTVYEAGDPLRFVLLYATFYGEWTGTEGVASQGNYFVQKSGYVVLEPSHEDDIDDTDTPTDTDGSWDGFTDSTDGTDLSESDENYSDTDFELIIFDGDAINRNSIQLFVNMAYNKFVYNSSNSSFSGTQMITYTTNGQNANKISNCSADVSVYFLNMSNNQSPALSDPHVPLNSLGIQFQVTNSNCSISFTTNVMTIVSFIDTALPVYIVLISIAGIISVYSTYHMVKNFPANVEELKSMSVWSLWITSAWELFLAVFHVYVAIKYFRFYILIVSFIFLFTISMLRKINELILIVSRVERGDILPLNSRVLMSLIPMCLLCATYCVGAFVPVTSFFLLTGSLYMVPQIYRIWKRGERPSGYYLHNFAFAFSKIFFVAYYLLYTDNLFEAPQNVPIACTFIGLIFVQMVIVLIQRHLPQCLFTWRKYIKKPSVTAGGNEDCCICFEALAPNDLASSVQKMHDQIVQTPCDHKFHRRCIEEWVNLRGSCPLDRNKLKLEDLLF